jgi:hypothetical protein
MGEGDKPAGTDRDERLRAALRANLKRRKAQARGRKQHDTDAPDASAALRPPRDENEKP